MPSMANTLQCSCDDCNERLITEEMNIPWIWVSLDNLLPIFAPPVPITDLAWVLYNNFLFSDSSQHRRLYRHWGTKCTTLICNYPAIFMIITEYGCQMKWRDIYNKTSMLSNNCRFIISFYHIQWKSWCFLFPN